MALTEDQLRKVLSEQREERNRFTVMMIFVGLGLGGIVSGITLGGLIGLGVAGSGIGCIAVGILLYWALGPHSWKFLNRFSMTSRGEKTPVKKAVSLERIEEHLDEQDKETQGMAWFSFAIFGAAISLVGIGLWFGSLTTAIVNYVFLIVLGIAIMIFARRRVIGIR